MKILIAVVLVVFSFQMSFGQYDDATQSKIKVKFFAAEELLKNQEYSKAIDKVNEIEVITNGPKASVVQNIKVKAYIGLGMYERAKKELNILYRLNPPNEVLKEIGTYEFRINDGIQEKKANIERVRFTEIQRKEEVRLARIRKIEEAKQVEIRKEEKRIFDINQALKKERDERRLVIEKYINLVMPIGTSSGRLRDDDLDIRYFDIRSEYKDVEVYCSLLVTGRKLKDMIPYRETYIHKGYNNTSTKGANYIDYVNRQGEVILNSEMVDSINMEIKIKGIVDGFYISEGLLPVVLDTDKGLTRGYLNRSGKIVIQNKNFEKVYPFNEGLAMVLVYPPGKSKHDKKNLMCGFINKKGDFVIEPKFNIAGRFYLGGFSEGLAGIWHKGKSGYIDKAGEVVIPLKYYGVGPFKNGKAVIQKKWKGKQYIINKNGELEK